MDARSANEGQPVRVTAESVGRLRAFARRVRRLLSEPQARRDVIA